MKTLTKTVSLLAMVGLLFLSACSSPDPIMVDSKEFKTAVTEYLAAKSMGMKVNKFKELSVDGDTASAVVSLELAEDMGANIRVSWRFNFERTDDTWAVTTHKEGL